MRFACEQGLTVLLVSWRNPDAAMGGTTWDDYVESGAIKAIEIAKAICSADKINAVGWCVGGTILSSALAVLRARGDKSVASMTLLALRHRLLVNEHTQIAGVAEVEHGGQQGHAGHRLVAPGAKYRERR